MEENKLDEEIKENKEKEENKENKENEENKENKENKITTEELKENNDENDNENENTNNKKEEKINNDSIHEKDKNQETETNQNNTATKENINLAQTDEKGKRHRRGKNEISERRFKCPDCEKSYLSAPALMMHRKTKHNYTTESDRKLRGRPKKENQLENSVNAIKDKFNDFFNIETRKKLITEENNSDNIINTDVIKENLNKIFKHGKSDELFSNIENIEDYNFYKLMINKWDIDKPEIGSVSYCDNFKLISLNNSEKCNTPPLDDVFYLYLKEFANKTNKDYFWFINKFIVLLREFINDTKKENIRDEYKTEEKKEYSQLYCAEDVPENCNDFFLEFMEPKKFFGLNNNELIELTQHFCFWLYLNKYSHSYLTLI